MRAGRLLPRPISTLSGDIDGDQEQTSGTGNLKDDIDMVSQGTVLRRRRTDVDSGSNAS
jgi:hypothetical protein